MKKLLNSTNIVQQDILRQVELLCTQEDPPACTAACPLHLDARELCRLIAQGDVNGARKLYQKAIPFARIVAATCDAPCEQKCKRLSIDESVCIRYLEQSIAQEAQPLKPPMILPKKEKRAAIAGGGLCALAAANDLARKGYKVTLFEKTGALGGRLLALPESVLPSHILQEEINALLKLPVTIQYHTEVPLDTPERASSFLLKGFDAAFVACASPLDALSDGETLLVQGQTALLAGRRSGHITDGPSSIYDIYDGRSAATAMDRIMQAVHIMAGREKEGSSETRLFTNLAPFHRLPPVRPAGAVYTPEEAQAEAGRCIQCQCMECVKKCGFLQHYKRNPRQYVREVYNNLSIAMGQHHANAMINTCALCGQCEAICPNGLDMRQVFLAARQRMVDTEKMPPSAHEFAMLDMAYSLSDAFYLAQHQPEHTSSGYVFFPGCQLPASEPGLTAEIYRDLRAKLAGGVGLWLACCGVMAHWAGEKALFEDACKKLQSDWQRLGCPKVIAACPTCASTLQELCGIPAVTLFEVLTQDNVLPSTPPGSPPGPMVLHHACGARHADDVRQSVLTLAQSAGLCIKGGNLPQEQHPCCGYGGLVSFVDRPIADEITQVALGQLVQDEGAPVLTYCVNCRDRYLANGQQAWHILEFLYPKTVPLNRSSPTWSQRQENRARLKQSLLFELWGKAHIKEPDMKLTLSPGLEEKIQDTHILHSDIKGAITYAEAHGEKLLDAKTGHFVTSYRPGNVTFWVEYAPESDGFLVFNAYCHRMAAVLTDKFSESRADA